MVRKNTFKPHVGDRVRFRWRDERSPTRTYNVSAGEIMSKHPDGTFDIRVANGHSYERIPARNILERLEGG